MPLELFVEQQMSILNICEHTADRSDHAWRTAMCHGGCPLSMRYRGSRATCKGSCNGHEQ